MKKIIFIFTLLMSGLVSATEGQGYVNESCLSCHGTEMFNREGSKIKNSFDLRRQVSYCRNHLSVDWFPDDEKSVVKYLNDTFYHFK